MIMLGTIVNAAAVVIGGGAGMLIKKGLKKDFQDSLMKTLGTAVIFLGEKLKKLVRAEGDNLFVQGFVTNALVVCVGAMAVVGSLQDGINHDPSTLFAKAVLDAMISMVFAASLGVGVLFAAVPLFLYQGAITLLAGVAAPFFTDEVIGNLSYIGNVLIAVVGVNLLFGKTVKVGNMLPALIFAVILGYFI